MMIIESNVILETISESIKIISTNKNAGLVYQKVLSVLGKKLNLHSTFVILDKEQKSSSAGPAIYLWCSPEKIQPTSFTAIAKMSLSDYKTHSNELEAFESHYSITEQLPDSSLRRQLKELGIQGFVHVPILIHGYLRGIMCLNCTKDYMKWSDEQLDALKQLTYLMSTRLEKTEQNNQISTLKTGLEMAINHANDIVCVFDEYGHPTYISQAVERILNLKSDVLIGQNLSEYIHPDDLSELRITDTQTKLTAGESTLIRFRAKNKSGKWVLLESNVRLVMEEGSTFQGYIAISRVLTNEKVLEKTIKPNIFNFDQNVSDETFLSMAAHQFKNPLSIIYSNAELLELSALEQNAFKYTERIKNQVTKLIDLTNDIMLYGKTELKQTITETKNIEVISWTKEMCELFFSQQQDGRTLELLLPIEPINVKVNPIILQSIFVNLVDNGFKYSPNTPPPICKISALNRELLLEVRDFGIGIPEDEQKHLYEPFFRATNAKETFGNGLGLAVVKRFTDLLNGRMTCTSSLNKGTSFWVYLPIIV